MKMNQNDKTNLLLFGIVYLRKQKVMTEKGRKFTDRAKKQWDYRAEIEQLILSLGIQAMRCAVIAINQYQSQEEKWNLADNFFCGLVEKEYLALRDAKQGRRCKPKGPGLIHAIPSNYRRTKIESAKKQYSRSALRGFCQDVFKVKARKYPNLLEYIKKLDCDKKKILLQEVEKETSNNRAVKIALEEKLVPAINGLQLSGNDIKKFSKLYARNSGRFKPLT